MIEDDLFKITLIIVKDNKMYPEDWEDVIFSSDLTDEEVLYLVMYARRKNSEYRNRQ